MTSLPSSPGEGNGPSSRTRHIDLSERPPSVVIIIGDQRIPVHPSELDIDQHAEQLSERLHQASSDPEFILSELFRWTESECWVIFQFIARITRSYVVKTNENGECFANLFDAMLSILEGDECVERCEFARRVAVLAAATVHPTALPSACSRIVSRLQALRVRGTRHTSLLREAQTAARAFHQQTRGGGNEQEQERYLSELFPDAPLPPTLITPDRWGVAADGVRELRSASDEPVIAHPVMISRRLVDIVEGTEWLELLWWRDGRWQMRVVPRALVATPRTLTELADFGLPINSHNAKAVVRFLADFENANLSSLPLQQVSRRMGWHQYQGRRCFLWGRSLLTHGEINVTSSDDEGEFFSDPSDAIIFRGGDQGEEQIVDGFSANGDFTVWFEAVRPLAQFPRVRFAINAALCPILLDVLDSPNFIVSFSGPTSQGKSTTLRVAASCWGQPDERSAQAAIGTWDATRVWRERAASVECDLPLILDDTKRARQFDDISQTIYDVVSGRGRGRGSLEGLRSSDAFRTVLISSGESPLTHATQAGGAYARVLELWGSPFDAATSETANLVTFLNESVCQNYGHAGPRFAQFLVNNQDHRGSWRERYQQLRREYEARASDNSVALRMAAHFAVLDLTVHLAAEAGCVPWPADALIQDLWPVLIAETADADQAAAALRYVWSWACANRETFRNSRESSGDRQPPHGWSGRWDARGGDWTFVGFYQNRIHEVLQSGGFESNAILRTWRTRGWMRTSPDRPWLRSRVGDGLDDLAAIERQAIEEVLGGTVEESETRPSRRPRGTVGQGGRPQAEEG